MKSSDVYIWVPAWCVHTYVCAFFLHTDRIAIDRLQKSILMTRILYADGYLVWNIFSTLFSLTLSRSLACLIARWLLVLLLEINHFGFYPFSPREFSEFSLNSNWVSTLFKCFVPFSLCVSLEYFHSHFLKKHTNEMKKRKQSSHDTHKMDDITLFIIECVSVLCIFLRARVLCTLDNPNK